MMNLSLYSAPKILRKVIIEVTTDYLLKRSIANASKTDHQFSHVSFYLADVCEKINRISGKTKIYRTNLEYISINEKLKFESEGLQVIKTKEPYLIS